MAENKDRKNWVEAQLKARGMEVTPENRKQLRQEYDALQKEGDLTETAINVIREMFPAYSYLLEADGGGFGADVRKIMVNAVLQNYVFSQYLTMTKKAGAEATAMAGQQRDQITQLAQKYFIKPTNADINSVMTGTIGLADLENRYKTDAKSLYPHLSELIDAGSTLDDIARPYIGAAAQILGLPEDQIDMVSPSSKFRMALENVSGDKQPRRMTLTEWARTLRTDSRFGYQFTQQANQDAANIGLTIARAFGKVM